MRKGFMSVLAVILAVSLTGCGVFGKDALEKPEMYIEKAELTEEEENIVELLGAEKQLIYDFKLDESVKCVQVNTYELKDGEWEIVSGGGGHAFSDKKGRLALSFDDLRDGMRTALQGEENDFGATEHKTNYEKPSEKMGRATSILNDLTEVSYEQEIPLVIQISTTKNTISSYDVEYFFQPENYEQQDYEYVTAVTVRFSQKSLNEQEGIK